MNEMATVRTKLHIPARRRELVARPHLFRRLDEGLQCRLILISGPAGFGKTTLLAEWIRTRKVRAAWLSLDEGDNDLHRFLSHLTCAVQSLLPETLDPLVELLNSAPFPSYELYLSVFINALDEGLSRPAGQDSLLVLDDYHLVEAQAVHEVVAYLLEHLPTNFHLAISTRADPPLPLARLRARAQLTELRTADLRFTDRETEEFLNRVMGCGLDTGAVMALAERTEGWIAGLQLVAISMQGRDDPTGFVQSFTGSHRFILDYLVEEVLQRQPAAIQAFLTYTSILDRFCGPLCDDLIAELGIGLDQESQSILEYLDRSNLFVLPLDDRREWYRYHRLFADLLRKRLYYSLPEMVAGLHQRASRWFAGRGDSEEAIEHALLANDASRAADLAAQAAEAMMMRSEFVPLRRWLERLPEEQIAIRPALCVFNAWILFMSNRPVEEVERWLALIPAGDESGTLKTYPLRAFIAAYSGRIAEAKFLARQATKRLPQEDYFLRSIAYVILAACEFSEGNQEAGYWAVEQASQISDRTGNVLASVMMLASLAENYRKEGQLRRAELLCRQALSLAVDAEGRRLPIAGRPLIGLGDLMREWNRLEAAETYLSEGIELIEKWGILAAYSGYVALARLRYAQGRTEEAFASLVRAKQLAAQTRMTPIDDWAVAAVQAAFWIAQGNLEPAERWAGQRRLLQDVDETSLSEGERFARAHMRKYEWVVLARLRLHQGKPDEALHLLSLIVPEVERVERVGLLIEIQVLRALAFQQMEMEEDALHALEAALVMAEPEGYIQTFLCEGESLQTLLSAARRRGIRPEYAARLLAAFWKEAPSGMDRASESRDRSITSGYLGALSEREMEVLRLLRGSLTVPEIASRLCVADSTARSHIKSIYGKLDVHRRMDAVQRAVDLGLLRAGPGGDPTEKPAEDR